MTNICICPVVPFLYNIHYVPSGWQYINIFGMLFPLTTTNLLKLHGRITLYLAGSQAHALIVVALLVAIVGMQTSSQLDLSTLQSLPLIL